MVPQKTSIEALRSVDAIRVSRREVVLDALRLGDANDRMLSERVDLPINQVVPRRFELVEQGLVEEAFRAPCPVSGRETIFWRVVR
jgi:hypothetical protein